MSIVSVVLRWSQKMTGSKHELTWELGGLSLNLELFISSLALDKLLNFFALVSHKAVQMS